MQCIIFMSIINNVYVNIYQESKTICKQCGQNHPFPGINFKVSYNDDCLLFGRLLWTHANLNCYEFPCFRLKASCLQIIKSNANHMRKNVLRFNEK
jgi:hypothetical protein